MSCTAAHLRSRSLNIVSLSDMIEGSYRSWDLYTTGQLVDGLQQKKENWFSFNGNGIMSSFLGRQFHRSTQYIHTKHTHISKYTHTHTLELPKLCYHPWLAADENRVSHVFSHV